MIKNYKNYICLLISIFLFTGCPKIDPDSSYPPGRNKKKEQEYSRITGKDGITFNRNGFKAFGKSFFSGKSHENSTTLNNNRNQLLWSSAIDLLDFIPLASTDSSGGTIITEWYSSANDKNTRFKINVFILDKKFTPSSIKVKVYKQVFKGKKGWEDVKVSEQISLDIENRILEHAKNIKNK